MIGVKGIDSERRLKPHHDDRKAKRIQPRLEERKPVCQWCELHSLLCGDLRKLSDYFGSYIHIWPIDLSAALPGGCS